MAQINNEFSTYAASVFSRKYSHLQFFFQYDFLLPDNPSELFNVTGMRIDIDTIDRVNKEINLYLRDKSIRILKRSKTQINFENVDQILKIFKHFGHEIKRIKSDPCSWTLPLQVELIGKLISQYSSESLVDVEFEYSAAGLLEHITKPLVNVKSVAFLNYCSLRFKENPLRTNELFPAVRRLTLNPLVDDDFIHFDFHMPNLEHVSLERSGRSYFPHFLMKNPQIRSISLYSATPDFLQKVNDFLPQLETLKISQFELLNGSIQFPNVTKFVTHGYYTTPANLHFPRLQTLHADFSSRHFDDYVQFFNEHNHLTRLHFEVFEMKIFDSQFQQLTTNLTDLKELTLQRLAGLSQEHNLNSSSIVEFLKSHVKVHQLNIINFPKHREAELQEQLDGEWDAKIINHGLSFQRKIYRIHSSFVWKN